MESEKKSLRIKFRSIRKGITSKGEKDCAIYRALINMPIYKNADKIMFYISLPEEPDTKMMIEHAFAHGKSVLVPKVISSTQMKACKLSQDEALKKGGLGVYEPEKPCFADSADIDLIVVPGMAFDKKGVRLGFGGGYYDRFLSGLCCETVGLCYEDCFADSLIKDDTDVTVKYIITEKGIVYCGG